ncbi:2752_t:CDS:2 [Funneliformis geosporum]|uniref:2752_t:CDS:1 n=1 Tax=Funneliformis geosporum TaxID=1117311 RepID=A0A9W4SRH2_9GLOM|nr:2752_t:CDS:2 [Funneliformis geosporum]
MDHEIIELEIKANKPHEGSPITMIEISPNAKYIVTYSEEDKTIVGWNVKDDKCKLIPDFTINSDKIFRNNKTDEVVANDEKTIFHMCVSDEKMLVLSYVEYGSHTEGNVNDYLNLIDMKDQDREMELYFEFGIDRFYCNFNLNGEFILYNISKVSFFEDESFDRLNIFNNLEYYTSIIWIYSTKTEMWKLQKIYEVPQGAELIDISKHDTIRLRLNNNIYERSINDNKIMSTLSKTLCGIKTKDITMACNEVYIYLKINTEITVYSVKLGTLIASFDLKAENYDKIYEFIKKDTGLHCLLLSLFDYNSITRIRDTIIKSCRKLCLEPAIGNLQSTPSFFYDYQLKKYIFVIMDGYVWKIKFEELEFDELEKDLNNNLSKKFEADEVTESWNAYFGIEEDISEYENPFIPYENINEPDFFQEVTHEYEYELKGVKKVIYIYGKINGFIGLRVIRKDIDSEIKIIKKTKYKISIIIYEVKLFDCKEIKEIVISTNIGFFIFDDNLNLNHFLNICDRGFKLEYLIDEPYWISHEKNDRYNFLNYNLGLINAIKKHDIETVDDIYKKCLDYFNQDLVNNKAFLSIITNSMPLLNQYYPEYITKYILDTCMIIDAPDYDMGKFNTPHLYPFEGIKLVNLTPSIPWLKYNNLLKMINRPFRLLIQFIGLIISTYLLPISFAIYYVLNYFNIINYIANYGGTVYVYYRFRISHYTSKPTITFMLPYFKFGSYPEIHLDSYHSYINEILRPSASPFTKTIIKEIYETWDGEVLINFKWNLYGKYYYAIIWMVFNSLFGCFTAAAVLSEDYITKFTRDILFKASFILATIHTIMRYRQTYFDISSLLGDLSVLGNWEYKKNPFFVILLTFLFFIVVLFLLNLLIGLLSNAIDEDNNRIAYLLHKAEVFV